MTTSPSPEPEPATDHAPSIPAITHDEFLTAIKPLLEICGLDADSMLAYLHITAGAGGPELMQIHAAVVAMPVEEGTALPITAGMKPAPAPVGEFAELYWPVVIRVI